MSAVMGGGGASRCTLLVLYPASNYSTVTVVTGRAALIVFVMFGDRGTGR